MSDIGSDKYRKEKAKEFKPWKPSEMQVGGDHYKKFSIQPSLFIRMNKIAHLEGDAINYICRHQYKNGREDLEKAIHCLQLILEWQYPKDPMFGNGVK